VKRQRKYAAQRPRTSILTASEIEFLPNETILAINEEIERRFSEAAQRWLTDARWARHTGESMDLMQPFAWAYGDLLSRAVADHADLLTQAILATRSRRPTCHWMQITAMSLRFTAKFVEKDCVDEWLALFIQHHRKMQDPMEVPDWQSGFSAIPVSMVDLTEVPGIAWKKEGVARARNQIRLRVIITAPSARRGVKASDPSVLDFASLARIRSFTYAQAAAMFECNPHTIQRWIREGKLLRASRGRVKNDPHFTTALYELHGIPQPAE
jgi:hypothetical protein